MIHPNRQARPASHCFGAGILVPLVAVLALLGTVSPVQADGRVEPGDFQYLGAFRLPHQGERPKTFAWGGSAMTFRPDGDPQGAADGFAGSLFVMGHDRLAYGEMPDGNQVAEVGIPAPVPSKRPGDLPVAPFVQRFHDVAQGQFAGRDELPRVGMAYLKAPATGPKIHIGWGQHMQPPEAIPTHGWFDPNLAASAFTGTWFIGQQSDYSVNGYLFEIPADWAARHVGGRVLATGRYRDGGWSGMGPTLFAYRPWTDDGRPAPPGTRLETTVLLQYESSRNTETIERALAGYQHPDEWEGGAWLTTTSGKSAVLFAGTKSVGAKYWYGFVNPAGPEQPCVAGDFVGQFPVCRLADGTPCPATDLHECSGHNGFRGWWSTGFAAQFILYDPADLARVAQGEMKPWMPQPYASLTVDEHLLNNPAGIEPATLGVGPQRHYRLGEVAYDRAHDLLYVLEPFADEDKPVVHVWKVQ
jgi:hypothetical protein